MKKIICTLVAFATTLSLFCGSVYADSELSDITLYNTDGKTTTITESQLDEHLNNGWYMAPVVTMYDLSGNTTVVAKDNIEDWKTYGWYETPVTLLYAPDGNTIAVEPSKIDEYLNDGWYLAPVVTMYDLSGNTTVVATENIEEWNGYGWYLAPVILMYDFHGNTTVVAKDNIEEWKGYGWSETPISKDSYYVNQSGLSSQTEYLIWVSKSEYKVRVFQGSKGKWNMINSFTCAIGKPSTPTCEGTYKYYQSHKMWDYGSYYVGPIMRFNGGYAIHSTLIYKDGTPKDNRVGMKLSLGCVRLQPQDINWLFSTIPLYTTIHITG